MKKNRIFKTAALVLTMTSLVFGMAGCGKSEEKKKEEYIKEELGLSDQEYKELKSELDVANQTEAKTEAPTETGVTSFGYPIVQEIVNDVDSPLLKSTMGASLVQVGDVVFTYDPKTMKTVGDVFAQLEGSALNWDLSVSDKTFHPCLPESGADIIGKAKEAPYGEFNKIEPVLFVPSGDGKYTLCIHTLEEMSTNSRSSLPEDYVATPVRDCRFACFDVVQTGNTDEENIFYHNWPEDGGDIHQCIGTYHENWRINP